MISKIRLLIIVAMAFLVLTNSAMAQNYDGIPVLLYHRVDYDKGPLTLSPVAFEMQISTLYKAGYRTISPYELVAYIKGEKVSLPPKPILITFDDGYEDNYKYAYPILQKFNYKAIIFMIEEKFNCNGYLTIREAKEMTAAGFFIGSHSITHSKLTDLTEDQLQYEIVGSKALEQKIIGKPVDFFAYPGGYFNSLTVKDIVRAGYFGAFTTTTGLNRPRIDNVFLIKRLPIFNFTNFDKLFLLINSNVYK